MINIPELCVEMLQDNNCHIVILPMLGLLETGCFAQEGVLFVHHDSFSDIEPLLHIARNDDHTNIISEFSLQLQK